MRSEAALLLEHAVELVAVLHVDVGGRLVAADARAVEEEAQRRGGDALARRVRVEDLVELRRLLDLEEGLLARLVADAYVEAALAALLLLGLLVLRVGHRVSAVSLPVPPRWVLC